MRLPLLAALVLLPACDRIAQQTSATAEYDPEEAGTVDHALCLLGFTGVPLTEVISGHHLVELSINGTEGTFVLDTGANATVMHAGHAARFGIGEGAVVPGVAVGLGGSMQARRASVESMNIGGVPIRRDTIMLSDLGQVEQLLGQVSGKEVSGIVGQDLLSEHRAVIDVAKPLLYLIEADEDPAPIPAEKCRDGEESDAAANDSAAQ